MKRPLILISNDDGYFAEGLSELRSELIKLGTVVAVCPHQNCSGVSHQISIHKPLRLREVEPGLYALNGSPVDCIHIALHVVLEGKKPDLVVSGINHGVNLGEDTAYSGTVAAAYEGQVHGIPSVAVSTDRGTSNLYEFKKSARIASSFCKEILEGRITSQAMWNLNVPPGKIKGIEFSSLDKRSFKSSIVDRTDPRGLPYYWIGPYHPTYEAQKGTDYWAFNQGFISATPIKVEMSHFEILDSLRKDTFYKKSLEETILCQ